jgi:hypothetical protein
MASWSNSNGSDGSQSNSSHSQPSESSQSDSSESSHSQSSGSSHSIPSESSHSQPSESSHSQPSESSHSQPSESSSQPSESSESESSESSESSGCRSSESKSKSESSSKCTCVPRPINKRRSWGEQRITNIVGISAKIKTRYGTLCCEGESTQEAASLAFVNILLLLPNQQGFLWAQMGYKRARLNDGTTTVKNYLYAEFDALISNEHTKVHQNDASKAPADGEEVEYQIELNSANGTAQFNKNGTVIWTLSNEKWKNKTGSKVMYEGEVHNTKDYFPGTESSRCKFTACKYKASGGNFTAANLVAVSENPSELRIEASGDTVDLWDGRLS